MDKENGDNNEKGKGGGHSSGGNGQDPSSLLDAASLFGKFVLMLFHKQKLAPRSSTYSQNN